jgi:mono/diheme cytochrome c family protein
MDNKPDLKAEIDFMDLMRKPHKLFGYSYIFFVVILSLLGISYVQNLTSIGKNTVPPMVVIDSSSFVQDIPFQTARSLPTIDVMKVATPTPELVDKGKELFRTNCASCHGDDGQGDGPTAVTLSPKPRNFHVLGVWKNGSKVSQIFKTLQEGIPGSAMATFGYMPPLERFALIHYVRSFSAGQPTDSRADLQGLETTYQLSKGSNTSGQIPVKKAARIIETEAAPEVVAVAGIAGSLESRPKSAGLQVFERVARDRKRIFTGLLFNGGSSLQSVDQFIKTVTAEPTQLGFGADVVRLSASEWTALYQFLNELKARRGSL